MGEEKHLSEKKVDEILRGENEEKVDVSKHQPLISGGGSQHLDSSNVSCAERSAALTLAQMAGSRAFSPFPTGSAARSVGGVNIPLTHVTGGIFKNTALSVSIPEDLVVSVPCIAGGSIMSNGAGFTCALCARIWFSTNWRFDVKGRPVCKHCREGPMFVPRLEDGLPGSAGQPAARSDRPSLPTPPPTPFCVSQFLPAAKTTTTTTTTASTAMEPATSSSSPPATSSPLSPLSTSSSPTPVSPPSTVPLTSPPAPTTAAATSSSTVFTSAGTGQATTNTSPANFSRKVMLPGLHLPFLTRDFSYHDPRWREHHHTRRAQHLQQLEALREQQRQRQQQQHQAAAALTACSLPGCHCAEKNSQQPSASSVSAPSPPATASRPSTSSCAPPPAKLPKTQPTADLPRSSPQPQNSSRQRGERIANTETSAALRCINKLDDYRLVVSNKSFKCVLLNQSIKLPLCLVSCCVTVSHSFV